MEDKEEKEQQEEFGRNTLPFNLGKYSNWILVGIIAAALLAAIIVQVIEAVIGFFH
ncbi:hypothetical protein JW887_06355 [Candidatus Dojkabacteria bacterium]|nr:hypothetical protein [Candidatus Dojkabacteria bacterium]